MVLTDGLGDVIDAFAVVDELAGEEGVEASDELDGHHRPREGIWRKKRLISNIYDRATNNTLIVVPVRGLTWPRPWYSARARAPPQKERQKTPKETNEQMAQKRDQYIYDRYRAALNTWRHVGTGAADLLGARMGLDTRRQRVVLSLLIHAHGTKVRHLG